jgi:hypothetical protein
VSHVSLHFAPIFSAITCWILLSELISFPGTEKKAVNSLISPEEASVPASPPAAVVPASPLAAGASAPSFPPAVFPQPAIPAIIRTASDNAAIDLIFFIIPTSIN